jgi:hypothetical protein
MKGYGLLIAAASLQLVVAAIGLVSGLSMFAAVDHAGPALPRGEMRLMCLVVCGIAVLMIAVAVCLLLRQRWAWIASMAINGLPALFMLAMSIVAVFASRGVGGFGLGFGELIILLIIGSPMLVIVGLLIGGRHAVFAREPTVAVPPVTPRVG